MDAHRTQIGVNAELLAQAEQSLLRPPPRVGIVPARTSYCAEQHRIRRSANIQRLARQRGSARVERAATDQAFAQLEGVSPALSDRAKDAHPLGNHLGTDSVARKNGDFHRVLTRAGWADS